MTYNQVRFIKKLLAVVLVCFGSLVAYNLYQGLGKRQSNLDTTLPVPEEPDDPLARQVELTRLDSEGNRAFVLRAAESVGRSEESQTFRDVEIEFPAGKEKVPMIITADLCEYDNLTSAAHLEGNVVIRDEKSLRVETSVLDYRQNPDLVWTREHVRFFRDGLEGESGSLKYEVPDAKFYLRDDVTVRLTRDEGSPIDITSQSATIRRNAKTIQFIDDVFVQQATRELRCNDLQLFLTENEEGIERIEAYENVDLVMVARPQKPTEDENEADSAQPAPGLDHSGLLQEPGTKRILTKKLEVLLREDGETPERMRAMERGKLILESTPDREGDPVVVRELEGHLLAFDFDDQGRLMQLRGRGGVTLTLAPKNGPAAETKRVEARQFEADFDVESGDLTEARCLKSVQFSQGDVRATADRGVYRSEKELLTLTESPLLWNQRASLEAETIQIDVVTGDLEAFENVRSTSKSDKSSNQRGLFPTGDNAPVHFVADHLDYRQSEDLAIYTGAARGFQGDNRIEAEKIQLRQTAGELEAEGSVRTVFHQKVDEKADEKGQMGRTVTVSWRLVYHSAENILHYRRNVIMRSDDINLKGKQIDVVLEEPSNDVLEIHAAGNVEIEAAEGKALGDNAKYLPKSEEVRVMGDRAQLQNGDKLTEGKELTFFLSDDRIFVDGREQRRTKTIYASKPRPK
jgi:LPS export ABC transporter protein LptC/lipopolysaccharide transport protein LptA